MKNSVKIKEAIAVSVKRYGKVLTLLMALMALSSGAWAAQSYYVYGKTQSTAAATIKNWSKVATVNDGTNESFSFQLDVSDCEVGNDKWYYLGINRNSNGFIPNGGTVAEFNDHIPCDPVNTASGSSSLIGGGSFGITIEGNCNLLYLRFTRKSSDVQTITFNCTKGKYNYNSCDQSQTKWEVEMSAGSSPVQVTTWILSGGFNNRSEDANIFVGTGDRLTTTINLPANTTYAQNTENGFWIIKKVNNDKTYYKCSTTISQTVKDYKFRTTDENCGLVTGFGGVYTFTVHNLNATKPQLDVTYPTIPPFVPVARFGDKPSENAAKDLTANVYIAAQGCDGSTLQNVSQIRVRFWKEGDDKNAQIITLPASTYVINTNYPITIPSDNELLASCIEETNIIMEVAALNETGWSDYSDRVSHPYTSSKVFNTNNLSKNFTACDGGHQFALSEMVTPTPDSWTASPAEFSQQGGDIIWDVDGKTQGGTYTFTFEKDRFTSKTATLTITFTGVSTESEITAITTSPSEHITPYTDVTITPTISGDDITSVQWSVQPVASIIANDNNTATFRAKAATTYTVTAVGVTDNCAKTEPSQDTIEVEADSEDCY